MNTKNLVIFTRTPLHVGAGSSVGAVDQPVQRERHTGFPIIPGSSIKGVMRAHFTVNGTDSDSLTRLFGPARLSGDDDASQGHLSFGEAKLLLFPVRAAKGSFAFVTSSLALRRFLRDAGGDEDPGESVQDGFCLAGDTVKDGNSVVLEEYRFEAKDSFPEKIADRLSTLLDDPVLASAKGRLVLLSDGDFSHFARNACEVKQHVKIDVATGTAVKGGLFNEECVPAETLFHSTITELKSEGENQVHSTLSEERVIQFGGDATTGLGFCSVKLS